MSTAFRNKSWQTFILENKKYRNFFIIIFIDQKIESFSENFNISNKLNEDILIIDLPPGDRCLTKRNSYYKTRFIISCDYDISKIAVDDFSNFTIMNCKNYIKMRSRYACPDNKNYALSHAIKNNSTVFTIVLFLFGY